MEDETVDIITSLSPIFRNIIYRRIRGVFRQIRNVHYIHLRQHHRKCSFCHVSGHNINTCCNDSAIIVIARMCLEIDNLIHLNISDDEIQTSLEAILRTKMINEIKLFVSLFDYGTSYSKRQLTQIVIRHVILMRADMAHTNQNESHNPVRPTNNIHVIYLIEDDEDGEDNAPTPAQDELCPICFDPFQQNRVISTNCNHKFCTACTCQLVSQNNRRDIACPLCRSSIDKLYANSNDSYLEVSRLF